MIERTWMKPEVARKLVLCRNWLWKEWSGQKNIFLLLVGIVPIGAWVLVGFKGDVVGSFELTLAMIGVALVHALAVGTELFGAERGRRSRSVVHRLSGALVCSFLAKLAIWLGGGAVLLIWTKLSFGVAWWLCGESHCAVDAVFGFSLDEFTMLICVAGTFFFWGGLLATAVSYLRGSRVGADPRATFRSGVPVVVIGLLATYGYGAFGLNRSLTIDPQDRDFRLDQGWLGREARFVFLNAHRGRFWFPGSGREGEGTPPRPMLLDLASGRWRWVGNFGDLVVPYDDAKLGQAISRIDRDRAQVDRVVVLPSSGELGDAVSLDAFTGVRQPMVSFPQASSERVRRTPGGSLEVAVGEDGTMNFRVVDLDGEVSWEIPTLSLHSLVPLSASHILVRVRNSGDRRLEPGPWQLHDVRLGWSRPALGAPPAGVPVSEFLPGRALLLDSELRRLEQWDPSNGHRIPLVWEGREPTGVDSFELRGRADDPRRVLFLRQSEYLVRSACAVVDMISGTARLIVNWRTEGCPTDFVGLDGEGGVWVIEDDRRLVRLGPERDQIEIVFPKRES